MAPKRAGRGRAPSPKKARVADPIAEKVKAVAAAFEDDAQVGVLESLPEVCRTMLGGAVKNAIGAGSAKDERHAFQTGVGKAIGDVLSQVVKNWEGKLSEANSLVASAESAKAEKQAVVSSASSTNDAKVADAASKKEAAEAALEAQQDATSNLGMANDDVDGAEIAKQNKTAQLEKATKIQAEHYEVLKACDWPSPEEQQKSEKKLSGPLITLLKKLKAEGSLLTALPSVLSKTPDNRGTFDNMVLSQLETLLTGHIDEMKAFLGNFESDLAAKKQVVSEKEGALKAATEHREACDAALEAANVAKTESAAALQAAEEVLADFDKKLETQKAEESCTEAALAKAKENSEAFTFLFERVLPAPEPAAVEEPAAEPAA